MTNNTVYVFYGYASEYVLHPLFLFMREQGFCCKEISPDISDNRQALQALRGKDVIFITSYHVFLDENHYYLSPHPGSLSVLEMLDILKPRKSVYYPHDISEIIHMYDSPWIASLFDLILMPFDGYEHLSAFGNDVHTVGWIKKNWRLNGFERLCVSHAFGNVDYYHDYGWLNMYERFSELWAYNIAVKCGECPNAAAFESFLNQHNVHVISAKESSHSLIQRSEVMITNTTTSVTLESTLSGRFTINLLDDDNFSSTQESLFAGLPNLKLMSICDALSLLKAYFSGDFIPPQGEDLLKPFDYQLAKQLICK